jgi:hypothetical protein
MFEWLVSNKEWIFSGVGVALVSWLFVWLFRRKDRVGQRQSSGKNSVNIQAGNDIRIDSKDD